MIINDQASTLRLLAINAMQELYYSQHSTGILTDVIGSQTHNTGRPIAVTSDKGVVEKLNLTVETAFDLAGLENKLSLPLYF